MLWLLVVVLVYIGLLAGLTALSIRPYRIPLWISPGSLGDPQEEVEFLTSDGVKLRAWWTKTPGSDKVVIFCHGYMMNRCELVPEAHFLSSQGYSCLCLDFRAHGRSQSAPSSIGYRERKDVAAAVQFVQTRVPNARRILVGSSMGSAAICFALADDPTLAETAIIDSAYGRLDLAISGWWRFLGGQTLATFLYPIPIIAWPINHLNPYKVDVSEAIEKIGGKPLLFIHGTKDTLALPAEAERNYAAARGKKKLVWFEDCNHSEGRWLHPEKYRQTLTDWLAENGL